MPKKRSADLAKMYPKRKGRDGHWLCRWCGIRLEGRKENFCTPDCEAEVFTRVWPSYARQRVRDRDHGVCASCKCPTHKLYNFLHMAFNNWQDREDLLESINWPRWAANRRASLWDMDHIKPVRLGGGLCGLDNLQTLCIPCHLEKTAEQASLRAKRRMERKAKTRRKKG